MTYRLHASVNWTGIVPGNDLSPGQEQAINLNQYRLIGKLANRGKAIKFGSKYKISINENIFEICWCVKYISNVTEYGLYVIRYNFPKTKIADIEEHFVYWQGTKNIMYENDIIL